MSDAFSITANQMLVMFIFMAIGFTLKKINFLPDNTGGILSKIIVNIFFPALCYSSLADNLAPDSLSQRLPYLYCGICVTVASVLLAFLLVKLFFRGDRNTEDVYSYALAIPNLGFFGYPIVGAVLGADALTNAMVFCLPLNLYIYTIGMYMLNPKRQFSARQFLSPTLIALALGIIVGLLQIKLPAFISGAVSSASDCLGPSAMIMTGFVLARAPVIEMVKNIRAYFATALRLVVLPLLFCFVMMLIGVDKQINYIASILLAMPLGLNTVIFPEAYGGDSKTGAQACFVSNVFALITIPMMFSLLARILGI